MSLMERLRNGVHADPSSDEPMVAVDGAVLACAVCGQATEDGAVTEARDVTPISPSGKRSGPERTLDLGTCVECRERADLVAAIVGSHPALVAAYGAGSAPVVVGHVLDALALIAQPYPGVDVSDHDLAALIHHLNEPGAGLAWRRWVTVERAGQVASWPFAYLPDERVAGVRTAYGAYLHERAMRNRPPVRIAPPETSDRPGCLFCGIGAQPVAATRVAREGQVVVQASLWWPLSAPPAALGGAGPRRIKGHVCAACADALSMVGAVGRTAMVRALLAHLRAQGAVQVADAIEVAERDEIGVQGLLGWGGLPVGTPPNAAPWAHVDLSAIEG